MECVPTRRGAGRGRKGIKGRKEGEREERSNEGREKGRDGGRKGGASEGREIWFSGLEPMSHCSWWLGMSKNMHTTQSLIVLLYAYVPLP